MTEIIVIGATLAALALLCITSRANRSPHPCDNCDGFGGSKTLCREYCHAYDDYMETK